jgi:hypothetical protein
MVSNDKDSVAHIHIVCKCPIVFLLFR